MKKTDPDDRGGLPVKLDSTTNGEYWPRPLDPRVEAARRSAAEALERNARRAGMTRREYLATSCGAATCSSP